MPQKNNKSQIVLVLRAMQNDLKLSAGAAGKIYSIDYQKLSRYRHSILLRYDVLANLRKLTDLEESVLIQHILDLAAKRFPSQVSVTALGFQKLVNRTIDLACTVT
jgi:hypothetical protein